MKTGIAPRPGPLTPHVTADLATEHPTERPLLFTPLTLRGLTFPNRVWLAPMCQYSVVDRDGVPNDWHLAHLGARVQGGFGLVITEAAAVVPEGRISPQDVGIWNQEQTDAWRRVTDLAHGFGPGGGTPIGIQLAHAGRKGSTYAPGRGRGSVPVAEGGWTPVGPTTDPFPGYADPARLSVAEIAEVVEAFAAAAHRADEAGFDVVEVHAAHGYLLHEFLSPLVNTRTDAYGGSFEGRTRIVVETVDAVRAVWPADKPLLVRFSATDWVEGGWSVADTARLSAVLADHGVDLVDVSSGGAVADAAITTGPGYQVPFAEEVRTTSGLAVGAVGEITDPAQAERVLAEGRADVVLLGRAALREPSWPQRAAHELGVPGDAAPYPDQYERGRWR